MRPTIIHCQHNMVWQHSAADWTPCKVLQVDYELFRKRFGRAVKRFRKLSNKNQTTLAEDAGTDQGSISRIESGKQGFDSQLLFQLAHDGLGIGIDALIQDVYHDMPEDAALGEVLRAWSSLSKQGKNSVLHIISLESTTPPLPSAQDRQKQPASDRTAVTPKSTRKTARTR